MKISNYFLTSYKNGENYDISEDVLCLQSDEIIIKVHDNDVTTYFYKLPIIFLDIFKKELDRVFLDREGDQDYTANVLACEKWEAIEKFYANK